MVRFAGRLVRSAPSALRERYLAVASTPAQAGRSAVALPARPAACDRMPSPRPRPRPLRDLVTVTDRRRDGAEWPVAAACMRLAYISYIVFLLTVRAPVGPQ
jgi:hypothetical protein